MLPVLPDPFAMTPSIDCWQPKNDARLHWFHLTPRLTLINVKDQDRG